MANSTNQTDNRLCCMYESLVQHRIHQDQLLWSRVQIVHAIEAGILIGGFTLAFIWQYLFFAGLLLIIGGVLTLFLFFIVKRDYADHMVNAKIMDKLAERLLPSDMKENNVGVRWAAERRGLLGHHMIYISIIGFTALDFVWGISLLCRPTILG